MSQRSAEGSGGDYRGRLVAQPHGGALLPGGTGAAGAGRPPSAIREHLRGSWAERVRILVDIAEGRIGRRTTTKDGDVIDLGPYPADRVRAIELLDRYGGVEKMLAELDDAAAGERLEGPALVAQLRERVLRVLPLLGLDPAAVEAAMRVQRATGQVIP
jgi:hypothetical protein